MSPRPTGRTPDNNALMGNVVDRGKWYVYDTLRLAPGTTVAAQYQFFATCIGQADPYVTGNPVKTKLETNLTQANLLNPPNNLILNNLGFYFASDNKIYDIKQITKYGFIEFKILDKIYAEGHMWRHPPGAGFAGATSQTTESVWTNGIPSPNSCYFYGEWAKIITPLQRFTLTINFQEVMNLLMGTNILTAQETAAAQSSTTLPTLLTTAQGGNGIWCVAFMNGLYDRPVQ